MVNPRHKPQRLRCARPECEEWFTSNSPAHRFCSRSCERKAADKRYRDKCKKIRARRYARV